MLDLQVRGGGEGSDLERTIPAGKEYATDELRSSGRGNGSRVEAPSGGSVGRCTKDLEWNGSLNSSYLDPSSGLEGSSRIDDSNISIDGSLIWPECPLPRALLECCDTPAAVVDCVIWISALISS